jgi:hypothetical protein
VPPRKFEICIENARIDSVRIILEESFYGRLFLLFRVTRFRTMQSVWLWSFRLVHACFRSILPVAHIKSDKDETEVSLRGEANAPLQI